jgi:hypothetical protein
MAKPTIKNAMKRSMRGWGAVLSGGILLTLLALADAPDDCQLRVLAERLPVRSEPRDGAPTVNTFPKDSVVDGTAEVSGTYRRLADGSWAADEFLALVDGTTC